GTPPRTRLAAATRPTGPAPAINTRSSIGMMFRAGSSPGQAFAGKRHRALQLVFTRHELAAQELADGRFWDRLDEDVAPRPFEIGEPRGAAELIELLGFDQPRRLTKAETPLPQRSSAPPPTATSEPPGCSDKQLSISPGEIFPPPLMIMSSTRPVTKRSPSTST